MKHCASRKTNQIRCPYRDCQNKKVWDSSDMLKRHLVHQGFMHDYEIGPVMAREGLIVS
jgi:hypothetical protein